MSMSQVLKRHVLPVHRIEGARDRGRRGCDARLEDARESIEQILIRWETQLQDVVVNM